MGLASKHSSRWQSLVPSWLQLDPSKWRLIVDSKSPGGFNIAPNDRTIGAQLHLNYFSQSDLLEMLAAGGADSVFIMFDVKAAYTSLRLRHQDLWAFVTKTITDEYGIEYWVNLTNTFGWTGSEQSWQMFAGVLGHLLQNHGDGLLRDTAWYVDNFFTRVRPEAGRTSPSQQRVDDSVAALDTFLEMFGVPAHERGHGTTFAQLGLHWCTHEMLVSIPDGKLAAVTAIAAEWRKVKAANVADLESINGLFTWLAVVYPIISNYLAELRELIHLHTPPSWKHSSAGRPGSSRTIDITGAIPEAFDCILAILSDGTAARGAPISASALPGHLPTATWRSDAGTKIGLGAINLTTAEFFARAWTPAERIAAMRDLTPSSTYCEAMALLDCVRRWATPGLSVLETDSDDLHFAWARGWSADPATNLVLREAKLLCARAGMTLHVTRIRREDNCSADSLSNLDLTRFAAEALREFGPALAQALTHID